MEDYKKYYGVILFISVIVVLCIIASNLVVPKFGELDQVRKSVAVEEKKLQDIA